MYLTRAFTFYGKGIGPRVAARNGGDAAAEKGRQEIPGGCRFYTPRPGPLLVWREKNYFVGRFDRVDRASKSWANFRGAFSAS